MATLYGDQSANRKKTWALMAGFLIVIILLGWAASWYFNSQIILFVAVGFSLVMNGISFWFSHKIALKSAGAEEADPKQYQELHNLVENLCITAGIQKPGVYIIEDPSPNAFATGRNEETAAVAVTTGLLQLLDRSELEGVIAHEIAHITNRDILLSSMVVVLVGFVTLLSDFFLRWSLFGGGGSDNRAGLLFAIVGIALAILSPIIAMIIQLAISRKREFLADASGALLTRYPEGLANALRKIDSSVSDRPLSRANHATAHLYFENPYGGDDSKKGFLTKAFMTHPPTSERINALMSQQ
ncbi:MAG: M48 family metallopeptidase [Candidatus Paceibacterota bacterium]